MRRPSGWVIVFVVLTMILAIRVSFGESFPSERKQQAGPGSEHEQRQAEAWTPNSSLALEPTVSSVKHPPLAATSESIRPLRPIQHPIFNAHERTLPC